MIAGIVKDLVATVRTLATGAPKVSGTIYVTVRLELDGDTDDGKRWCDTHGAWEVSPHAFPAAAYDAASDWLYQLPAAATTSKVSATKPARIRWRLTDNASTPASETASSAEFEEMIYSSGAAEAATGAAASVTAGVTLAADQAVNVTKWSGTAVPTPDTAGYPKVTLKTGTGTGEVNLSSGAVPVTGDLTATMKTSVTTAATAATPTVTLASGTHTGAVIPTVTTTTNLTNAPTAGDLTAAMKASVTAAVPTATANAAGLLAATAYGSVTVADHLKRTGATTAGLSSGAGTDTEVFYAIGDASRATPIVTFTVDASGTRSAVTYG